MSNPIATYSEGTFPHKRTSVLFPDRIEWSGSTVFSSSFRVTIPFSLLTGHANRSFAQPRKFGAGICFVVIGALLAALLYSCHGLLNQRENTIATIVAVSFLLVGFVMLALAKKIESALFVGHTGLDLYNLSKVGPDRVRFEDFVNQIQTAIRSFNAQALCQGNDKQPMQPCYENPAAVKAASDPIATYTESSFPEKQESVLYADRIEVTKSNLIANKAQFSVPLELLSERVDRTFSRSQLFGIEWMLMLVALFMWPRSPQYPSVFSFIPIFFLIAAVAMILLGARRIEGAHFVGSDGLTHYSVLRSGPDRARFDGYVAEVLEAARDYRKRRGAASHLS